MYRITGSITAAITMTLDGKVDKVTWMWVGGVTVLINESTIRSLLPSGHVKINLISGWIEIGEWRLEVLSRLPNDLMVCRLVKWGGKVGR